MKFAPRFQLGATPRFNRCSDSSSARRRSKIRVRIPARRHAEKNPRFDSSSAPHRNKICVLLAARRHAEMKSAPGFQLSATAKWNPRPDSSSAPRRGLIGARIPARRDGEVKSASEFQLGATLKKSSPRLQLCATPKWNPHPDASSAPHRNEICVLLRARRHAEVESAFGFQLGATPK